MFLYPFKLFVTLEPYIREQLSDLELAHQQRPGDSTDSEEKSRDTDNGGANRTRSLVDSRLGSVSEHGEADGISCPKCNADIRYLIRNKVML